MSSITRNRRALEMSKDGNGQGNGSAEPTELSDYAPRRGPGGGDGSQIGTPASGGGRIGGGNQMVYLTPEMIAPEGDVGDAVRLTRLAGPTLDQIGKTTADKVNLSADSLVQNARAGAETILGEAKIQADRMIAEAEAQAADMRAFANSIRAYTDRKAFQVNAFCAFAESTLGSMHSLGSHFQSISEEEASTEKDEEPIRIPDFLNRGKAAAAKA